jgi:hypothetical protein
MCYEAPLLGVVYPILNQEKEFERMKLYLFEKE